MSGSRFLYPFSGWQIRNISMISINPGIFIGAALSSGIEFLEIVAIAYALSSTGYRREALCGSVTGIVAVVLAAALLVPPLVLFPLRWLHVPTRLFPIS